MHLPSARKTEGYEISVLTEAGIVCLPGYHYTISGAKTRCEQDNR